jgi:MinD superfamily P-loop ATPase
VNISIVSGKGGAGKTFVATNLFEALRLSGGIDVELIDANVESPNSHIFLANSFSNNALKKEVRTSFPIFDEEKCTYCGRCVHYCEYNAIVMIKDVKHIFAQSEICKSCGACSYACNDGAITETKKLIGEVSILKSENKRFVEGRLSIGSTHIKTLIKAIKQEISSSSISIIDAPTGISSYISEIVHDSNFVVIVAEPSVFGLHDLKLMVESLNRLRKDFGVVVNRYRGEYNTVHDYIKDNDIPLLLNIPFKTEYAEIIAKGELIVNNSDEIKDDFLRLFDEVKRIYIQKSMYR